MKEFHVTGTCNPDRHYMVEIRGRIEKITRDSISFEAADEIFVSYYMLALGLQRSIGRQLHMQKIPENIRRQWETPISKELALDDLGERISELCSQCGRKVVLMIDEVDKSSDN